MRDPFQLDPAIRAYLQAENDYCERALADTKSLQQSAPVRRSQTLWIDSMSAIYRRTAYSLKRERVIYFRKSRQSRQSRRGVVLGQKTGGRKAGRPNNRTLEQQEAAAETVAAIGRKVEKVEKVEKVRGPPRT